MIYLNNYTYFSSATKKKTTKKAECLINNQFYTLSWENSYLDKLININKLISGSSKISLKGLTYNEESKQIIIPENTVIINNPPQENKNPKKQSTQNKVKKILIIRVIASDVETSIPQKKLQKDILTIKKQYADCSYGQLIFNTAEGGNIKNGVLEVKINSNVKGTTSAYVVNEITKIVGGKPPNVDHVMYCIPKGTIGSWIAYAYVNSWLSVYNDNQCENLSVQMHEIGHNRKFGNKIFIKKYSKPTPKFSCSLFLVGLGHAGENGWEYGDQTGYVRKN